MNFIRGFSGIIYCYVTTISFLTRPRVNHPVFSSDFNALSIFYCKFRKTLKVDFPNFASAGAVRDRLCGLVVRVSGYRYRGPGFDPRRYQIF